MTDRSTHHRARGALGLLALAAALAAPAPAQARACPAGALTLDVYEGRLTITATGVGCRAARGLLRAWDTGDPGRLVSAGEGNGVYAKTVRGFRCESVEGETTLSVTCTRRGRRVHAAQR